MDCIRGFAELGKKLTLHQHSVRLPRQGTFFVCQSKKFIDKQVCCCVLSAPGIRKRCVEQRIHQRDGVAAIARIVERVVCVRERSVG